jgi:hypothetical protein
MHRFRSVLASAVVLLASATAAIAGDPSGTWTYTREGRDGQTFEVTMVLALKDGQLTGTVSGFRGNTNPIAEATFKDDELSFKVTVEFNGMTRTSSYTGKLEGDTITGSITVPGRDGGAPRTLPWTATRKKS